MRDRKLIARSRADVVCGEHGGRARLWRHAAAVAPRAARLSVFRGARVLLVLVVVLGVVLVLLLGVGVVGRSAAVACRLLSLDLVRLSETIQESARKREVDREAGRAAPISTTHPSVGRARCVRRCTVSM